MFFTREGVDLMLGHWFRRLGVPGLAVAVWLLTAGVGWAQRGGGGHGGGGHAGGGHAGGGHSGGVHSGGGHFGGDYYHHGHSGFYGGLYAGFYPGYYGGLYSGFYGYGWDYYPSSYRSFYYPYPDSLTGPAYAGVAPLGAPGVPFPPAGNTGLPPAPAGDTVAFSVRVPAGAEVWIEGQKTSQTGPVRQFESPPLTPGVDYTYEIRARWSDGGNTVEQTRRVGVRAGDRLAVSFAEPAPPPKPAAERPPQPAP